jgi:hypothetical protein
VPPGIQLGAALPFLGKMMMKKFAVGVVAVALFATIAARGAFSQQDADASPKGTGSPINPTAVF